MNWASKELKIKNMTDWYNVKNKVEKIVCYVLKKRTFVKLEVGKVFWKDTVDRCFCWFLRCIQNMSGYHGNLIKCQAVLGMRLKINESLLIWRENS
jgi:hypothetical protein